MNGISLGNVDLKVYMVFGEAEFAELKPKAFQVMERLDTGVNVALFSEVSVSVVCWKHHGYPVVSCVSRWLFIASAIYIFHKVFFSCRVLKGQAESLPHATKKEYGLSGEKETASHLRALRFTSVHAVFSALVYKKKNEKSYSECIVQSANLRPRCLFLF